MKFDLPSGKTLEMSLSPAILAAKLLREVRKYGIQGEDIADICLEPSVIELALECGKKAIYDNKRVDTLGVFDEEDCREDMIPVLMRIVGENINPFSATPLINFAPTSEK